MSLANSLAAIRAASLHTLAMSAPVKPVNIKKVYLLFLQYKKIILTYMV